MKEQNKTPEKELNKMETSNLPDTDSKTLVIRILSELMGRAVEPRENFNSIKQVMQTIKNNQSEMKNTLIKIKNNLQGINSRGDEAKNQSSDLECKDAEKKKRTPNQYSKKRKEF